MKAAYYQARHEIDVREAPDPEPGLSDLLIRVRACGICGTDQHIYDGDFGGPFPLIGGHELAGDVIAVGRDVLGDVAVGQRVAVNPNVFCGSCFYCRRGQANHCLRWSAIGVTRDGGFADYVRFIQLGEQTAQSLAGGCLIVNDQDCGCLFHVLPLLRFH